MAEKIEARIIKASTRTLDRLARMEPAELVLSIYLDLNPSSFATAGARQSQITSVLGQAELMSEEAGDEEKWVREDLEAVRAFLDTNDNWPADAGAVAIFRSGRRDLFDVIKLPASVPGQAKLDSSPFVEPMTDVVSAGDWAVVLVNRRTARIFLGSPNWLREVEEVVDDVHGQHDQGGWSQARYQRSVEQDVLDHIKHTGEVLMDFLKQGAFRLLAVAAAPELWPEVESKFHSDLKKVIAGKIEADIENASRDEVKQELEQLAVKRDHDEEKSLLARLREALGTNGPSSTGWDAVLEALVEKRIETLLIGAGLEATGVSCPKCGWVGTSAEVCPLDGSDLERDVDLVEKAIELTHAQAAEVHIVRYHKDLEAFGSVAALHRF